MDRGERSEMKALHIKRWYSYIFSVFLLLTMALIQCNCSAADCNLNERLHKLPLYAKEVNKVILAQKSIILKENYQAVFIELYDLFNKYDGKEISPQTIRDLMDNKELIKIRSILIQTNKELDVLPIVLAMLKNGDPNSKGKFINSHSKDQIYNFILNDVKINLKTLPNIMDIFVEISKIEPTKDDMSSRYRNFCFVKDFSIKIGVYTLFYLEYTLPKKKVDMNVNSILSIDSLRILHDKIYSAICRNMVNPKISSDEKDVLAVCKKQIMDR